MGKVLCGEKGVGKGKEARWITHLQGQAATTLPQSIATQGDTTTQCQGSYGKSYLHLTRKNKYKGD